MLKTSYRERTGGVTTNPEGVAPLTARVGAPAPTPGTGPEPFDNPNGVASPSGPTSLRRLLFGDDPREFHAETSLHIDADRNPRGPSRRLPLPSS